MQNAAARYAERADSAWKALENYLGGLPDSYASCAVTRRVDDATDDVWEIGRVVVQEELGAALSPTRAAMLTGWAGQLLRARDRLHVPPTTAAWRLVSALAGRSSD